MPYISKENRKNYLDSLKRLVEDFQDIGCDSKGDLNYCVSVIAWEWAKINGLGYSAISNAIGALQDAAAELRRRKLDPHEDRMIQENGDAYDDIGELEKGEVFLEAEELDK